MGILEHLLTIELLGMFDDEDIDTLEEEFDIYIEDYDKDLLMEE